MSPTENLLSRRRVLSGGLALGAGALFAPGALAAGTAGPVLRLRDPEANRVLNAAVSGNAWWKGASVEHPTGELFDQIKLQKLDDGGILAFVTGEGNEDFEHRHVVHTVWQHQDKLDDQIDGCMSAINVGRGHDPVVGADYSDLWIMADLGLFYGQFFQRMYLFEGSDGRTWLPYEKLDANFVAPGTWQGYLARRDKALNDIRESGALRSIFGNVLEVTQVYGVFFVAPGQKRTSRVSMVVRIGFGEGTGFLAQMGSKLPPVIKSGLRSGFEGSVAICHGVKSGRYK